MLSRSETPDGRGGSEEERDLARSFVAKAVDTLAPREKGLLLRFYVHDESFASLAQTFKVAEQTARGAVSLAKHAVLAKLDLPPITNREMKVLLAI